MSIRTRLALMKLDRRRRKLDQESRRVAKKDYDEWRAAVGWEYDAIEVEARHVITRDLIEEAERLRLPVHPKWDEDVGFEPVWTREAIAELRESIRTEKRERREVIGWWFKVIGTFVAILTGLFGALIGLISVWGGK